MNIPSHLLCNQIGHGKIETSLILLFFFSLSKMYCSPTLLLSNDHGSSLTQPT